jgi:hypothetical protein
MPICPKDGKYCIDDLCYGGTCIVTGWEPMEKCARCKALIEQSEGDLCEDCRYDEQEECDYDDC